MRAKYTHCTNSVYAMGILFFVSARAWQKNELEVVMQIAVFSDIHGNHVAFDTYRRGITWNSFGKGNEVMRGRNREMQLV